MSEFLAAAVAFPTVIFSILLLSVLFYWTLVILGALDLEIFDSLFGLVDTGVEGVVESLDVGLEGAMEGVDLDADSASSGGLAAVLSFLGLAGVPLTISLSLLILAAWFLTFAAMDFVRRPGGLPEGLVAGAVVAALALVVSIPLAGLAVRPLRRFFVTVPATGRRDLIGRLCTIKTGRVSDAFGQAEVDEKGAPQLIQVRCLEANELRRGSRTVVVDYDAAQEIFYVAPRADEVPE